MKKKCCYHKVYKISLIKQLFFSQVCLGTGIDFFFFGALFFGIIVFTGKAMISQVGSTAIKLVFVTISIHIFGGKSLLVGGQAVDHVVGDLVARQSATVLVQKGGQCSRIVGQTVDTTRFEMRFDVLRHVVPEQEFQLVPNYCFLESVFENFTFG